VGHLALRMFDSSFDGVLHFVDSIFSVETVSDDIICSDELIKFLAQISVLGSEELGV
jgi:hypothetical protein